MNYEEQIIGLKRVVVDMQKQVKALEFKFDQLSKALDYEIADTTKGLNHLSDHVIKVYETLHALERRVFPGARIAKRQIEAIIGKPNRNKSDHLDRKKP